MRAAMIMRQGRPVAPNVELVDDHEDPRPGPGELVVRTEASALNQLDLWVGRGVPGLDLDYPRISGSDGCGVVETVGAGVDEAWVGRRVVLNGAVPQPSSPHPDRAPVPGVIRMIGEHDPGCLAERFRCPAANVLDVGDADPTEAAAFALTHLTAWRMIVSRAELRVGQTVLITGIGGGVALAALNIARLFAARTIVTSRHQWKLDRALEHGADHAVLDGGEDWSREIRGLTGKRGVDLCVDSVGKAIHGSCLRSLAAGGTFVTCGATTGPDAVTDLARMFWLQLRLIGSTMGDMDEFREVVAAFRAGRLRPVIDSVHAPEKAADAFARLETGDQFGKVVVDWRRS